MSTRTLPLTALLVTFWLLSAQRDTFAVCATDCVLLPVIVTSELSLQLYVVPTAAGVGLLPLADWEVELSSQRRVWSVRTDTRGYVRFPDLPPGDYRLHVPFTIEPLMRDVRVVRSGPRRMIAAIANVACGRVCTVLARGPLTEPPPCLYARRIP